MKKFFFVAAFFAALLSCGGGGGEVSPEPTPVPTPTPEPEPEPTPTPTVTFAKGADISWASEMEAGGIKFHQKDGTEAPLLDVLKDCGINAIRLRVWVKPYGGWSGKEDVLAVAKKVQAAGMDLMIDFHYSDFFADPSRQQIPEEWLVHKDDMYEMCRQVRVHTLDVLNTLKYANVTVKWIQIGNETRNGMLWPTGQMWTQSGDIPDGRKHFAELYNAGYEAAKEVFPDALVMPHLNNAYEDNEWWFEQVKTAGAKFDAIALSHYPHLESKMWVGTTEKTLTPTEVNQYAVAHIQKLYIIFQVPIFISEVGVKPSVQNAASVLASFMTEIRKLNYCQGVFYWEPQVDGTWKPEVYSKPSELSRLTGETITKPWGPWNQGAFTSTFSPSSILDCFAD